MKLSHLILFVLALLFSSCQNNTPQPAKPEENVATIDTTMIAIPDPNDLLETLRGSWQSISDPAYRIVFADDTMIHYHNGQQQRISTVVIDPTCALQSCTAGGRPEDGWCFVEKTAGDGQQCMLVLKCNGKSLDIAPLGASSATLSFVKQ
ncbi:MAG: hypothetical protein JNL02_18860 [Saprospiraceae bacterium]|nr:hypothetical protein [Saprospiraceae bacterium]